MISSASSYSARQMEQHLKSSGPGATASVGWYLFMIRSLKNRGVSGIHYGLGFCRIEYMRGMAQKIKVALMQHCTISMYPKKMICFENPMREPQS